MTVSFLGAAWFYWSIGIAIGLPLVLIALTEWQHTLRRRGSALLGPVSLLRNYLLPLAALLLAMIGATQMPAGSAPVRIVGTLVAVVVLILMLSGIRASVFTNAPSDSWRRRMPAIFLDVIRFVLIAVGIGLIFAYIWGANVGGLFTALGITSIVIGLTLQNSVGQIISGLLMLFEQPFRLGDWIETERGKGRVTEVNWRAVHLETADGLRITPNAVLAGESFTNLSRPAGQHAIRITSVFAVEDRPDQVCDMLVRVASQLPECHPDLTPVAVPLGALQYRTKIPLRSPADDGEAEATFLRWIWYASRRQGLHLDEAVDGFSEPDLVARAIKNVVAPTLKLNAEQQPAMIPHARIERYGRGELIQLIGTVPAGMSFILSGTVRLTAQAGDGTLAEVETVQAGGVIGQATLIRHPIPGSMYAVDEVTLIHIDREAVERVVQKSPELLHDFGRSIEERRASVVRALSGSAGEETG
ncbi:MAG: mechanosensitive ion channel [Mycobacterium sp.]|nr:mechanosensitive ion channel [Mycobacterium sp.]